MTADASVHDAVRTGRGDATTTGSPHLAGHHRVPAGDLRAAVAS